MGQLPFDSGNSTGSSTDSVQSGACSGNEEEPDVADREERNGILEDVHFSQTRELVHQHKTREGSRWLTGQSPFFASDHEALSVRVHDHRGDVHDILDFPFGPHAHLFQRIEVAIYELLCPYRHYWPRQVTSTRQMRGSPHPAAGGGRHRSYPDPRVMTRPCAICRPMPKNNENHPSLIGIFLQQIN